MPRLLDMFQTLPARNLVPGGPSPAARASYQLRMEIPCAASNLVIAPSKANAVLNRGDADQLAPHTWRRASRSQSAPMADETRKFPTEDGPGRGASAARLWSWGRGPPTNWADDGDGPSSERILNQE